MLIFLPAQNTTVLFCLLCQYTDSHQLHRSNLNRSKEFAKLWLSICPTGHGGHSLIARGLYALHLEPWLDAFPDNIKVFTVEDLQGCIMTETMASVYDHVGLPPHVLDDHKVQTVDEGVYSELFVAF